MRSDVAQIPVRPNPRWCAASDGQSTPDRAEAREAKLLRGREFRMKRTDACAVLCDVLRGATRQKGNRIPRETRSTVGNQHERAQRKRLWKVADRRRISRKIRASPGPGAEDRNRYGILSGAEKESVGSALPHRHLHGPIEGLIGDCKRKLDRYQVSDPSTECGCGRGVGYAGLRHLAPVERGGNLGLNIIGIAETERLVGTERFVQPVQIIKTALSTGRIGRARVPQKVLQAAR